MFKRQRSGSVVCTSCGVLVGVNDETCYNCGRRNPGLWGFAPALRTLGTDLGFTPLVIGLCVVVYGLTLVFSRGAFGTSANPLAWLSPSNLALFYFGSSGELPVVQAGRWWTVFTAGWLHGGIIHIGLNMFALRRLAPAVADLFGPGRMVIIYIVSGVVGFTVSTLSGVLLPPIPFIGAASFTVGASASISGLIGAILAYGHRSGSSSARTWATQNIVMLLVIGLLFPFIDNWAHMGGLAGGYLAAKLLDPLRPERIDHVAMAVGCLAVTIGALIYSVVDGFIRFSDL